MAAQIKKYLLTGLLVLPILISCTNGPKQILPPAANNPDPALECVVPFADEEKVRALKDFEKNLQPLFPDRKIHLTFLKGDSTAYTTKIKVMMYSDNPPDIFYSGDEAFTEELYASARIRPLEQPLNTIDFWNQVIPGAEVPGKAGHIYAVPIDIPRYSVMLINTALFSEFNLKIPQNFAELKVAVKKFREMGIVPIAIGGKNGMTVYNMIESFASTLDYGITGKITEGKADFSGQAFSRAAQSVKELISLGAFPKKPETFSDAEAGDIFYSSEAAIYCTSSENLKKAAKELKGKASVLFYPSLDNNGSTPTAIVSGGIKQDCGLLISSATQHFSEAVNLAAEMSKYCNKYLYEEGETTIFNSDQLKWASPQAPEQVNHELTLMIKEKDHVNRGLCEYNISADKRKSIAEASAAFLAGLLSVNDYLKGMDINMRLK